MITELEESPRAPLRLEGLTNEILDMICFHAMHRNDPYPRQEKNPLDGLSRANKFCNLLCAPHHFRVVSICSRWELRRASTVLRECERLRNHTKCLKISIFPDRTSSRDESWCYKFVPSTAYDLHILMSPICWRLEELHLSLGLPHQGLAQDLRCTRRRHKGRLERLPDDNPRVTLNMPKLKKLVLGNYCEFILDQCPNVREVSSNGIDFIRGFHEHDCLCFGSSRLVEGLSKLNHLKHLELDAAWDCFEIARLVDMLKPIAHQIRKLALHGSLSYGALPRNGSDLDQDDDQDFYNSNADDAMDQILHDGLTSGFWEGDFLSNASDMVKWHIQEFGYNNWLRTRHLRAICRRSLNIFRLPNLQILTLPEIAHLGCQYRRPISTDLPCWTALDLERVHPTSWGRRRIIPQSPHEILQFLDDQTFWYPDTKCIATMAMECAEYLTDIIGAESDPEPESDTESTPSGNKTKRKKNNDKIIEYPWIHAETNFLSIVEGDVTWLAASVIAEECSQVEQVWFGDHVRITVVGVIMENGEWVVVDNLAEDHPKRHAWTSEAYTLRCTRRMEDGTPIIRKGVFMQKARNIYRW